METKKFFWKNSKPDISQRDTKKYYLFRFPSLSPLRAKKSYPQIGWLFAITTNFSLLFLLLPSLVP